MRLDRMVIALALWGCREPVATAAPVDETQLQAHVTSLAASYYPHDPAIARITNQSEVTIYENLCAGEIEGFGYVPGEWNASFGLRDFAMTMTLGFPVRTTGRSRQVRASRTHYPSMAKRTPANGGFSSISAMPTEISCHSISAFPRRSWSLANTFRVSAA
jgi:hypothetical protein